MFLKSNKNFDSIKNYNSTLIFHNHNYVLDGTESSLIVDDGYQKILYSSNNTLIDDNGVISYDEFKQKFNMDEVLFYPSDFDNLSTEDYSRISVIKDRSYNLINYMDLNDLDIEDVKNECYDAFGDLFVDNSTVGFFLFDNDDLKDVSENFNPTAYSNRQQFTDGLHGRALDFSNYYVEIDYQLTFNDSIGLTFNLNDNLDNNDHRLWSEKIDGKVCGLSIYKGYLEFYIDGKDIVVKQLTSDSIWHTVICDLSTQKVYFDGEEITGIDTNIGRTFSPNKLQIGGMNYDSSLYQPFVGYIDNVFIFNRSLTETEIKKLSNVKY